MLTIPTALAAMLPWGATALSSWLGDDRLKPGINALIALCAILITALACELLAGNFTGNYSASFLGVLGYVGVLQHGDLSVLYQYLSRKASPLAKSSVLPPSPPVPPAPGTSV